MYTPSRKRRDRMQMLQLFPYLSACASRVCDLLGNRHTWKLASHNVTSAFWCFPTHRSGRVGDGVVMSSSSVRLRYSHTSPQLLFFFFCRFVFRRPPFSVLRISAAFPCAFFLLSWAPLLLGSGVGVRWLVFAFFFSLFFFL